MKKILDKESIQKVKKYIETNINECVYLYLNLLNLDLDDSNAILYIDGEIDEIECVYLMYFNTLHIYSQCDEIKSTSVLDAIDELKPVVIYMPEKLSKKIEDVLPSKYQRNEMHVYNYPNCGKKNDNLFEAQRHDYQMITDFLYTSPVYQNSYSSKEELYNQMVSRFDNNEGRYFYLVEEGEIVAVEGINAETADIAVLGGLLVSPKMRGRGLAMDIKQGLHYALEQENKKVYCLINNPISESMSIKLGGYIVGVIAKFYIK